AGPGVRPLLHDQGRRQGDRTWARARPFGRRRPPRWFGHLRLGRRRGDDVSRPPPDRRRAQSERGRGRRAAGSRGRVMKVLFVDDDPSVRGGLRRMLRAYRDRFETFGASSGYEALAIMERESFDVIVTDMRMPGMDGAELLETVRRRYPD